VVPCLNGKGQLFRVVDVGHHGGHLRQLVLLGGSVQLLQDAVVLRAAVVVRAPNGVGAQGERVEEPVREPARAAEVCVRGQIDRALGREVVEKLPHLVLRPVVHHDHPIHRVRLVHHLLQRVFEQLNTTVGDNHGGGRAAGIKRSHGLYCARGIQTRLACV